LSQAAGFSDSKEQVGHVRRFTARLNVRLRTDLDFPEQHIKKTKNLSYSQKIPQYLK